MIYAVFTKEGRCVWYGYSLAEGLRYGYNEAEIEEVEESEFWRGHE